MDEVYLSFKLNFYFLILSVTDFALEWMKFSSSLPKICEDRRKYII